MAGNTENSHAPASTNEKLLVALRIRPLKQEEISKGATAVARKVDKASVGLSDPNIDEGDVLRQNRRETRQYTFDCVFDDKATQDTVYLTTTKSLVENVLLGFNATVFAYGATGSGKTFTMVGTKSEKGIMVHALNDLFTKMAALPQNQSASVSMSYMEIYNETIRDLLKPEVGVLDLREDAKNGVHVAGLSEVTTASTGEVMDLLTKGNKARTVEPTAANKTSSRSHALLQVNVRLGNYDEPAKANPVLTKVQVGKMYMIDLAGSERASQTQNRGKRLVEGAHINRSLLALGNCINALAEKGAKYVNFRDSKLTRLLKEALTGNCRTVMIAHISPASLHYEESRNTLAYADRAKRIRNKVKRNVMDVTYHVAQYQGIIEDLRKEIVRLKTRLHGEDMTSPDNESVPVAKMNGEYVKKLREAIVQAFQEQMSHRHRLLEIDSQALSLSMEFEKNSLIISEWEMERAKMGNRSTESKVAKDKTEKETNKDWDSDNEDNDDMEPDHVQQAWDELLFIQAEQQRYLEERQEVISHLAQWKTTTDQLIDEELPKINSGDQKELLVLLCKVHELEIDKTEMQAHTLLKEHELRRKDLMLMRYDRQRNLCDEIITRQRLLIDDLNNGKTDNRVPCPQDLLDLYHQYHQEMEDMMSGKEHYGRAVSTWTALSSGKPRQPLYSSESERRLKKDRLPPLNSKDSAEKMFVRRQRPPSQSSFDSAGKRVGSVFSIRSNLSYSENFSLPPLSTTEVPYRQNLQGINAIVARKKHSIALEAVQENEIKPSNHRDPYIRHARSDDNITSYAMDKRKQVPLSPSKESHLPQVSKGKIATPDNATRRKSLIESITKKSMPRVNASSAPNSPVGSSESTGKREKPTYQLPQHNMIFSM